MGELARERKARDFRISQGHLHAGFAAVCLSLSIAFAAGLLVGQRRAVSAEATAEGVIGAVPGESLVALLARVDAASDPHAGVDRLTFPQVLRGDASAVVPQAPPTPAWSGVIEPGRRGVAVDADPPPSGRIVVEIGSFQDLDVARSVRDHLRSRRLSAWMTIEQVDGMRTHRVGVGGFTSDAEARAMLAEVEKILPTSPAAQGAPRIVEP